MASHWTDADVRQVEKLYHDGFSDEDIAAQLGRTTGSISNIRQARRIRRPAETLKRAPEWTNEQLSTLRELYSSGLPNAQIAERCNRTRIAIKRMVTTLGLRRGSTPEPSSFDTETEKWRPASVNGYSVSSSGRVMSMRYGHVGSILSTWMDDDGYLHVTISIASANKRYAVHRLVALAFLGSPPSDSHEVAHKDGNPSNNKASNLRWATVKENSADRFIHGTHRLLPVPIRIGRVIPLMVLPAENGRRKWLCRCDCGTEFSVGGQTLRNARPNYSCASCRAPGNVN